MKEKVNSCGKLHCYLILRNHHSYPNLQQTPPWSIRSHQHWGRTVHQQKDYDSLKAQMMASNKAFFFFEVYTLLFKTKCYCTLNRPQHSININFTGTGVKKYMWLTLLQHSLYCGGMEPNMQYLQGMPVDVVLIYVYILYSVFIYI